MYVYMYKRTDWTKGEEDKVKVGTWPTHAYVKFNAGTTNFFFLTVDNKLHDRIAAIKNTKGKKKFETMKIRDPCFDLTILQVVVQTCGKGEEKNIYIYIGFRVDGLGLLL